MGFIPELPGYDNVREPHQPEEIPASSEEVRESIHSQIERIRGAIEVIDKGRTGKHYHLGWRTNEFVNAARPLFTGIETQEQFDAAMERYDNLQSAFERELAEIVEDSEQVIATFQVGELVEARIKTENGMQSFVGEFVGLDQGSSYMALVQFRGNNNPRTIPGVFLSKTDAQQKEECNVYRLGRAA